MNIHRCRNCYVPILIACCLVGIQAAAQPDADFPFESGEGTPLVGTAHPALFPDFKIEGYDYLEAAVSVEDKGAKVNWAPFLRLKEDTGQPVNICNGGDGGYSFFSETRFQLSQKDDITSVGAALKYNPLNPRSRHGRKVWCDDLDLDLLDPYGRLTGRRLAQARLEKEAFNALVRPHERGENCPDVLRGLETLLGKLEQSSSPPVGQRRVKVQCGLVQIEERLERTQADGTAPKDVAALFKARGILLQAAEAAYLNERLFPVDVAEALVAQLDPGQDNGCLGAIDFKGTDNERLKAQVQACIGSINPADYPQNEELQEVVEFLRRIDFSANPDGLTLWRSQIATLASEVKTTPSDYDTEAWAKYRLLLQETRKPIISLNYVISLFPILGGSSVDADEDELVDHEHDTKSQSLALSLDWRLGERDGLYLLLSRSKERESAEEGASEADYNGLGLTWSHVLRVLNDPAYKKTKDFKESLFVPSLVFGLAYERRECDSAPVRCAKGVLETEALTPFIDFKIKKAAQFRIGLPFKRTETFTEGGETEEEDSIDIVTLIAFQLGEPK